MQSGTPCLHVWKAQHRWGPNPKSSGLQSEARAATAALRFACFTCRISLRPGAAHIITIHTHGGGPQARPPVTHTHSSDFSRSARPRLHAPELPCVCRSEQLLGRPSSATSASCATGQSERLSRMCERGKQPVSPVAEPPQTATLKGACEKWDGRPLPHRSLAKQPDRSARAGSRAAEVQLMI